MKYSQILIPVFALSFITGCSEATRQRLENKTDSAVHRTERKIDNATLTTSVKSKLAADVSLGTLTSINVDSSDGTVTLSGTVKSGEEKRRAEMIAQSVEGVEKVINNLEVRG